MDDSSVLGPQPLMGGGWSMPPSPPPPFDRENYWKRHNTSVNAVSFGFVATAVLISMFLVLAIFERFLRPRHSFPPVSPIDGREFDETSRRQALAKSDDLNVESRYTSGVSVLMPGQNIPTFIANPVPIPCAPEGISWPTHDPGHTECCRFDTRLNVNTSIKVQDEMGQALVRSADTYI